MALPRPVTRHVYWPSVLKLYKDCPRQYYLKARNWPRRLVDNSAMRRGQVTHAVLARGFQTFQDRKSFPGGLGKEITDRLDASDFPSHEAWRQDVRLVREWVEMAIDSFDTSKAVVHVEKTLDFVSRKPIAGRPFTLKARVDLVLRHDDGTIEHLDWKTGKRAWVDDIQNVTCRLAVGRAFQERRIISTVSFLSVTTGDHEISREMTLDEAREGWKEIRTLVSGIRTDTVWTPRPSNLCTWCPYFQHGCQAQGSIDDTRITNVSRIT